MKALIIASLLGFSGKTSICLSLGLYFKSQRLRVGYFKPLSMEQYHQTVKTSDIDQDAVFVRRVLGLDTPLEAIAPIMVTDTLVNALLDGSQTPDTYQAKIKDAYNLASQSKEIVLVEGGSTLWDGALAGLEVWQVAKQINAPVLTVIDWDESGLIVNDVLASKRLLDDTLLGVVLNNIPTDEATWNHVTTQIVPYLESHKIPVYGVLPLHPLLHSISISELAWILNAEILTSQHAANRLIESFSIGAMTIETVLPRLEDELNHMNQAFITGGDRTELQAAVLESPNISCLILTGNIQPNANILQRAEDEGVVVLLAQHDTLKVVEKIENILGRTPLRQAEKLNRFQALLAQYFHYDRLLADLAISSN